jgi:NAD(P)H dehydrogenase (quinone)
MIVITGASGRVAGRTAELLAATGQSLRLMSRHPDCIPGRANCESVRGDFADPASLDAAFAGATAILVVSGSGEPGERARLHRNAFESAARAKASHVVYLSLQGSGPDSKYPYSRDHYLSEGYLAAAGGPFTVLRDAFYIDMFPGLFDADGVIRGPANGGCGAFVSREDVARVAAAVLANPPGGIHDVTGPEALTVADVARRLSAMAGRSLRYENEGIEAARARVKKAGKPDTQVDLSVGWFEAIAAGELARTSDTVLRFTGRKPLNPEEYFAAFPDWLRPLL